MKCFLGSSNFLEKISSLSRAVVFLYFFALITEEAFLVFPCYSLELYILPFLQLAELLNNIHIKTLNFPVWNSSRFILSSELLILFFFLFPRKFAIPVKIPSFKSKHLNLTITCLI